VVRPSILTIALFLSLPLAANTADQPPSNIEQRLSTEQMHATGLDTLSPAQLALLNRLLNEEAAKHEEARATAHAAKETQSVAATSTAAPVAAAAKTGPSEEQNSSFIGFNDKPITSRVVGAVSGWSPGTEFKLENGQTWKVLKGTVDMGKTLQAPEIQVIPGFAGRWFLQVDENLPKARVYRID